MQSTQGFTQMQMDITHAQVDESGREWEVLRKRGSRHRVLASPESLLPLFWNLATAIRDTTTDVGSSSGNYTFGNLCDNLHIRLDLVIPMASNEENS